MLQVSDVSKTYGDTQVLDRISFTLNRGDRFALIGPNGSGKTTLLRILMGEEPPDSGSVRLAAPRNRIGYLPQALALDHVTTVRDAVSGVEFLTTEGLAARVERLAQEMATAGDAQRPALERAYTAALDRLSQPGAALPDHDVERVLAGLALDYVAPDTPVGQLSGGQKTRLGLARLLLGNPELLILDEPTNHLDITALEWLEEYLGGHDGGLLVVSHDRTFLDRLVNGVLALDAYTHTLTAYPGTYTDYAEARATEEEKTRRAYLEQQTRIARLQAAADAARAKARRIEHETIDFHYRKRARKVAREGVVRQKRIERLIESEDYIEKPALHYEMKLEFLETPPSGQDVLILEDLGKRYGDHVLFRDVNLILRRGERIALLGANGTGKTTLLRLIVGEEAPSEGNLRVGANVRIGYLSQEQDNLDWDQTPLEFIRAVAPLSETDARTFLHYYLFSGEEVFVPIGSLSFGERARLALGGLVLQGCNLLLLDEPINHLDIPSRERFERALAEYDGT
ncbi:MAG: ABC-F family ATP-binding cassette domain-containing protein, partial [Chloroflexi bacterium]|nr:ABC-F family ATP-binding cassette domain-containing protein [Chloroflexota bacterium]